MTHPFSAIPTVPGRLPLLGHAAALARKPLEFLGNLSAHGPLVRVQLGTQDYLFVLGPQALRDLLVTHAHHFGPGRFVERARPLIDADSFALLHGGDHINRRRIFHPYFTHRALKESADGIIARTHHHVSQWHDGQHIDINDETTILILRNAVQLLFGHQLSPSEEKNLRHTILRTMSLLGPRSLLPTGVDRLPIPLNTHFSRGSAAIRQSAARHTDIALYDEKNPGVLGNAGRRYGIDAVTRDAVTLLIGAIESTASLLAWVLYELARHPELQEHARHGIHAATDAKPLTADALPRVPVLEKTVWECLRLYGPPLFSRKSLTDTSLDDYRIPAHTQLFFSPYATGRDPRLFDNSTAFLPDRWNDVKPPRFAFIPFSAGVRKCPGENLAMLELLAIPAALLTRWRLSLGTAVPVRPVLATTIRPDHLHLTVRAVK